MSKHHDRLDRTIWIPLTKRIKEESNYQCVLCGSDSDLQVDHIFPLDSMSEQDWEDGMPYEESNLRTLCRKCNRTKDNKLFSIETRTNKKWLS